MDKKNKHHEELQNRRDFFKKAAKRALPILGLVVLGPTVLSSCDKDETITVCDGCGGDCTNACKGTCKTGCSAACKSSCVGGCKKISRVR